MLYSLYLLGTKAHEMYNMVSFGKLIYKKVCHKQQTIYNIQDEIWEIIDQDEFYIFNEFICVT